MAKKNNNKKTFRKKVPRAITPYPFPRTKVAKLRYVEEITLDPGAPSIVSNGIAIHSFRANSCHDPNYSLGGHQPRGWDEHTALYNEYVVLGSKLTFQPFPLTTVGSSYSEPKYYGLQKRNESNANVGSTSNIGQIMERRQGQYRRLPAVRTEMPKSLTASFSHKKTFKTNPSTEMIVTEGTGANKTHQEAVLYDCWIMPNANATQNEDKIPCLITVEYIVLFGNPKPLAAS